MSNKKISIIGYSGHSFVCIDIAILNSYSISGYYDMSEKKYNPYNLKYLGFEDSVNKDDNIFVCIGDNLIRKKIFEKLDFSNLNISLIHPKATISTSFKYKNQLLICANAVINSNVKIGKGSIINTSSVIEHDCLIGDFVHIAPGAVLCGGVSIGDQSFIGAGSVVKQGVKIGKNVTVGAGSVVLCDVDDNLTIAGNPSKILGHER